MADNRVANQSPQAESSIAAGHNHNHVHNHGGMGGAGPVGAKTTKRPTSLNDIRNTVLKAVNASRPENRNQIQNAKQAVRDVSESQGQYCDESAEANLRLAWKPAPQNIDACKVWLPHGGFSFQRL